MNDEQEALFIARASAYAMVEIRLYLPLCLAASP